MSSNKKSWVWQHFDIIGKNVSACKRCQKTIQTPSFSTTAMINHVLAKHQIAKPDTYESPFASKATTSGQSSRASKAKNGSRKKKFQKSVKKLEKAETSDESFDESGDDMDFSNAGTFQQNFNRNNCYVCNFALSRCHYQLKTSTNFTETPVYEFLESFSGATIPEEMRMESQICLECFIIFERFDELQQQCISIQNKIANFFRQTHAEQIFLKQEPKDDSSDDDFGDFAMNENISRKRKKKNGDSPDFDDFDRSDRKPEENSETFDCETCQKTFKSAVCLKIHIATNHDQITGPVDCPICLKTSKDRLSLRSHMILHSGEKNYLCGRCGATFLRKRGFDLHMLSHDDIRPHPCNVPGCNKSFRDVSKMRIHQRVHTGEKKYECPHCPGKRFAQKYGMDLHIKKHHMGETVGSVPCAICGIDVLKYKMKNHLANAHDVAETGNDQNLMEGDSQ